MPQIEIPDVTVNENVGIIEIEIRRTGGDLSTNSKIVVGSRNGSATGKFMEALVIMNTSLWLQILMFAAHSDYVPVARTNSSYAGHLMRFKKNLFTPRSEDILKVMIIDDDKGEPTETFEIYLIEVIEDAYVVKPVGTITILDNDGNSLIANIMYVCLCLFSLNVMCVCACVCHTLILYTGSFLLCVMCLCVSVSVCVFVFATH